MNHTSHHYFVGKLLNSQEARSGKNVQSIITKKFPLFTEDDKTSSIYTPLYYLGYYNENYEQKLLTLLDPILEAIALNYDSFNCYYKGYTFSGKNSKYSTFSLFYEDDKNIISDQIKPFLANAFTKTLNVPEDQFFTEPLNVIPFFRVSNSVKNDIIAQYPNNQFELSNGNSILNFNTFPIPRDLFNKNKRMNYFNFNSIDILRATPIEVKAGRQSAIDKMKIDLIRSIPLSKLPL